MALGLTKQRSVGFPWRDPRCGGGGFFARPGPSIFRCFESHSAHLARLVIKSSQISGLTNNSSVMSWSWKLGREGRQGVSTPVFIRRQLTSLGLGGSVETISRGKKSYKLPPAESVPANVS